MIEITNAQASERILNAVAEETLIQEEWSREEDGRWYACLLGSMEPGVIDCVDQCNGKLMPLWMAEVTVTLFDGIAEDAIYPIARRYGRLVGIWDRLWEEMWERVRVAFLTNVGSYPGSYNPDGAAMKVIENATNRVWNERDLGDDDDDLCEKADNAKYAASLGMFTNLLDLIETACNGTELPSK